MKKDIRIEARIAVEKLWISKPPIKLAASHKMNPLIMNVNKPRVNRLIGRVNKKRIGFKKVFNTPRTKTTARAVTYESITNPLIIRLTTKIISALVIHEINSFIKLL